MNKIFLVALLFISSFCLAQSKDFGSEVLNAVYKTDAKGLKVALKKYPNNNYPTFPSGSTALTVSLINSPTEEIPLILLANKAPFTNQDFQSAVMNGKENIVRVMIKNGANVNYQDSDGWSPLHMAVKNGYYNIVEMLLAAGANPNLPRRDGATAKKLAETAAFETKRIQDLLNKK